MVKVKHISVSDVWGCKKQSAWCLKPQPWHHNVTLGIVILQFSKNTLLTAQVLECSKGAHICPTTAYEYAKILCTHIIYMWEPI